ncbi:hypothetical protein [Enterococcus sp. DIV0876]|uniref:hypothetical protein n=1 Tax=Enterococcus sp. DIV0876 TaxID=2774633 RepID=UPI003D2FED17
MRTIKILSVFLLLSIGPVESARAVDQIVYLESESVIDSPLNPIKDPHYLLDEQGVDDMPSLPESQVPEEDSDPYLLDEKKENEPSELTAEEPEIAIASEGNDAAEDHSPLDIGEMFEIAIEGEQHLRAVLLGEIYRDRHDIEFDYGSVANEIPLKLTFSQNVTLTRPISGVERRHVSFVGTADSILFTQSNAANLIQFSGEANIHWQSIRLQGMSAAQGLIQTVGASTITFTDMQFHATTTTGRLVNNSTARIHFSGINSVTTASSGIPTLFLADTVTISGTFTSTHSSSNSTPFFEANQIVLTENAELHHSRTNNANTGAVFHLTGTAAFIHFASESQILIQQTGPLLSVPNANQDSRLLLDSNAVLDLRTGQGLSGNTASTIGEVVLASGSQLKYAEAGTVSAFPAINVGHRFISEDSNRQNPTLIAGNRTSNTTGAFIHVRNSNSEVSFGTHTQINVLQFGPMITAVATTQVKVGNFATIDNRHGGGFTGATAVRAIHIGDEVRMTITEPAGLSAGVYATFLAVSDISIGEKTTIDVPRTTTTAAEANAAIMRLTNANGQISVGAKTEITSHHRGSFITASLADVSIGKGAILTTTVGRGFASTEIIKTFIVEADAVINIFEHNNQTNIRRFEVRDRFELGHNVVINCTRTSTGGELFVQLSGNNSRFITGDNVEINLNQRGALMNGHDSSMTILGRNNRINITSARGITGNGMGGRSFEIGEQSIVSLQEHSATVDQNLLRFRESIILRENAELIIDRPSTQPAPNIRLTQANSRFTMYPGSKLTVDAFGPVFLGTATTDIHLGDATQTTIQSAYGFTSLDTTDTVRAFTTGKAATVTISERTSGSTTINRPGIRVTQLFALGEESVFTVRRERSTTDSRFIFLGSANAVFQIGKHATFDINQRGGIFNPTPTSTFILEEGATFQGTSQFGFTENNRRFRRMIIGENAHFRLTDRGTGTSATSRPMIQVVNEITLLEGAEFEVETVINRSELIFFQEANASLNINGVKRFELVHPTIRTGNGNGNLQRLIRSATNATANGLRINIENQKLSLWQGTGTAPTEEFTSIAGTFRINGNDGNRPSYGAINAEGRSRFMSVGTIQGTIESKNGMDITQTISQNNFRRLVFSEPEGLAAQLDPLSDQSTEITGYMYENPTTKNITYTNTLGQVIELNQYSERIEWGDYRSGSNIYRYFRIPLRENERLQPESEVEVFLDKPSVTTYIPVTTRKTVIKGVGYRAQNITLARSSINQLDHIDELHQLIIRESRAEAVNILTEADKTPDFRVVETNVALDVSIDGTYYAVLEVGNKAYQMTIGIDITSNLNHMRVTIPTKMIFESLYNAEESNRHFESEMYEIQNHSQVPLTTYINQLVVEDTAGIVLLAADENPLDYLENSSEKEEMAKTLADISQPLLALSMKSGGTQRRLYEKMTEQKLAKLAEGEEIQFSITGSFYGDYPRWVEDPQEEQGGYYEDSLLPRYRVIFRFVPG